MLWDRFQSNLSCCRLKWRCLIQLEASELTTMFKMVHVSLFTCFLIPEISIVHSVNFLSTSMIPFYDPSRAASLSNSVSYRLLYRSFSILLATLGYFVAKLLALVHLFRISARHKLDYAKIMSLFKIKVVLCNRQYRHGRAQTWIIMSFIFTMQTMKAYWLF